MRTFHGLLAGLAPGRAEHLAEQSSAIGVLFGRGPQPLQEDAARNYDVGSSGEGGGLYTGSAVAGSVINISGSTIKGNTAYGTFSGGGFPMLWRKSLAAQ